MVDAPLPHIDPGREGTNRTQQVLLKDLRKSQDPRKPRKDSDPGRRYNIFQRVVRKLQGK